jgi:hypothetical protein
LEINEFGIAEAGIEPTTRSLWNYRSATELFRESRE